MADLIMAAGQHGAGTALALFIGGLAIAFRREERRRW